MHFQKINFFAVTAFSSLPDFSNETDKKDIVNSVLLDNTSNDESFGDCKLCIRNEIDQGK
jgi:hypothetical protein